MIEDPAHTGESLPVSNMEGRTSVYVAFDTNETFWTADGNLRIECPVTIKGHLRHQRNTYDSKRCHTHASLSQSPSIDMAKRVRWNEKVRVRHFIPIEAESRPHCFYSQQELSEIHRQHLWEKMNDSFSDEASDSSRFEEP